jgi:hypothetical protein
VTRATVIGAVALARATGDIAIRLAAQGLRRWSSGRRAHPSSKGARVHSSGGKSKVVDGPFTETKERIAGFWLIQVKAKEEAIQWALRCPLPHGDNTDGQLELRQIFEASDFHSDVQTPEEAAREEALRAEMHRKSEKL